MAGAFIAGRRPKPQPSTELSFLTEESSAESPAWDDNHRTLHKSKVTHQK